MLRQRLRPLPYPHPAFFSSACFLSSSYFFNRPYGNQMGTKFWEVVCGEHGIGNSGEYSGGSDSYPGRIQRAFSPPHKRTEGRAPVWGSEFTSKDAALQGGYTRNRC